MPRDSPIGKQQSTSSHAGAEAESQKPEAVNVADHLHSAAIHLLRHVRKQDTASGEGPARLSALSVLVFGGPKTLKELAAAEQVKAPTMSRIVTGLERSRLVEITEDSQDARRLRIAPTAKGIRLLQNARERRIVDLASQLERLTDEELSRIGDAVEILRRLLQKWG
jgi:DNA-binding MarR family transcriptional regulator